MGHSQTEIRNNTNAARGRAEGPSAPDGRLRLVTESSIDELKAHAESWDDLYESSTPRVHTLSHAWVSSYLEHQLCPEESWRCLMAYDSDDLVGVLPVVARRSRVLGLPGTLLATPYNPDTVAVDILCKTGHEKAVLPFMLQSLRMVFPDWFRFTLTRVSELSPTIRNLSEVTGAYLSRKDLNGNGCLVVADGSFDDYFKSLHEKFSKNLRRLGRKFEALPDAEVVFLAGAEATPRHLDTFLDIEAAGWKGQNGTAVKQNPSALAFYRALTDRLAARGWLEWHLLKAEGKVLAIHMAVRAGSALCLLKIAFDENYSSYAPGNILMERTIKRGFEAGDISEVNCLTDMAWNRNWNMPCRAYYDVTLWPKRALSFAAGYVPVRLRDVVRDIPGARSAYHRVRGVFSSTPSSRKDG